MNLKKSSQRSLKSTWSMKFLFLMVALLGISFLCVFGTSNAQYQYKTQKSISKGGEAYIKVTSPAENEVWEKGKKYTIRWESKGIRGNVKILLVSEDLKLSQDAKVVKPRQVTKDKEVKPFEITKNTYNSGSYSYIVSRNLPNGIYKIQIMTIDESVNGESEATITIGGQKFASAKETSQAEQGKVPTVSKSGTQTGTAQTGGTAGTKSSQVAATPPATTAPSTGATPSTGITPSTVSTPSKGVTPSASIAGKSPAPAEKIVRQQVKWVKVSEAELKNVKFQTSTVSAPDYKIGGHSTTGGKIEVYSPKADDIWEAEKEYGIRWKSTGITGDVKITLAFGVDGKLTEYPITERTADTGSYRFRVPRNWLLWPNYYLVRVSTLDGTASGFSPGTIKVYTQYIDLECKIMDAHFIWDDDKGTASVFYVWWRNNGTRGPIDIYPVLVRIIKEPEELVVAQEDWGVGQIYPRAWYKLPEPRKFWHGDFQKYYSKSVNFTKGAYRIEVELDTQNGLGENQRLRDNNKDVARINIGSGGK